MNVTTLKRERLKAAVKPDMKRLAEKIKAIRKEDLDMMEGLWQRAEQSFKANGVHVHRAKDAKEAREIVGKIVKGRGPVVKSKTNVGREIGLVDFLRKQGIKVTETDCGDFLVDLMKEDAVHPVTPALKLDIKEVAKQLKCGEGGECIKEKVREQLDRAFGKAKVGVTGANFVSADGGVFLVENEGNIARVLGRETLVVVTSLEKIVASHQEGMECVLAQSRFGTNRTAKMFHVVGGPSGTGDLGEYLQGMQGAGEMHLVVLDNGRSDLLRDPERREILKCINCGLCVLACPLFPEVGVEQSGMRGVALESEVLDEGGMAEAWKCTGCGRCEVVCPVGINLHNMALVMRRKLVGGGHQTEANQVMMQNIEESGNTLGKKREGSKEFTYCC